MTFFLCALLGFATSRLFVWAVWRCLLWSTDRAARDPYFCREYARPRGGPDSASSPTAATQGDLFSGGPRVGPFSQGGV